MSGGIVVLVTGGRDFGDAIETNGAHREYRVISAERKLVYRTLDELHRERRIRLVLHGACTFPVDEGEARGADGCAQRWAVHNQIPYIGVPARWKLHGKGAGPLRNTEMVDWWVDIAIQGASRGVVGPVEAVVVAFPGGSGTADLIRKAADYEVIRAEMPSEVSS